jgi:hypothetical protein
VPCTTANPTVGEYLTRLEESVHRGNRPPDVLLTVLLYIVAGFEVLDVVLQKLLAEL